MKKHEKRTQDTFMRSVELQFAYINVRIFTLRHIWNKNIRYIGKRMKPNKQAFQGYFSHILQWYVNVIQNYKYIQHKRSETISLKLNIKSVFCI